MCRCVQCVGVCSVLGGFVLMLGQFEVATIQGWPHFVGWICTVKHTLGQFEVATIQGWPHFVGGFVL